MATAAILPVLAAAIIITVASVAVIPPAMANTAFLSASGTSTVLLSASVAAPTVVPSADTVYLRVTEAQMLRKVRTCMKQLYI